MKCGALSPSRDLANAAPHYMAASVNFPEATTTFARSANSDVFLPTIFDTGDNRDVHEGQMYNDRATGNNLEFFVDSEWYIKQPFLIPLDLSKSDTEIFDLTKELCESSEGFEPYRTWRKKVAARMTPFVARAKPA